MPRPLELLKELRRRRVLRSATLYAVGAWVVLQVTGMAVADQGAHETLLRYLWIAASIGFPLVLVFAWFFDVSLKGVSRTPPAGPEDEFELTLHVKDVLLLTVMVILLGLIASGAVRKMMGPDRVVNPQPATSPPASAK